VADAKEQMKLRILIWVTGIVLAGELFSANLPVDGRNPSAGQIALGASEFIAAILVFYCIERWFKRNPN
jgi:hypothetical protein